MAAQEKAEILDVRLIYEPMLTHHMIIKILFPNDLCERDMDRMDT